MKTREMLSVQRTKKVIEYVNEHGGRVSIVELASVLHCHYTTAASYIKALRTAGMEIELNGRIRNPREKILAYIQSHPGSISVMDACELHCSYETVRKYVRIFQSEGMDIRTTNEAAEEHADENTQ